MPSDSSKDQNVLLVELTSLENATQIIHYEEIFGEPLKPELHFTSVLQNVSEVIVLREQGSSPVVDEFTVVGK